MENKDIIKTCDCGCEHDECSCEECNCENCGL